MNYKDKLTVVGYITNYFAIIREVTVYSLDKVSLILPKGITIGSSIDDLKAAYGEPNEINDFDDEDLKDTKRYVYYNPKYNNDFMSSYWINVDTKTNIITSIRVANFYN
ncbi:MAG: hypothetical protein PUE01_14725 [Clostridiaceae bacterium]|nr:hypothetical protein [Clostridiaceae bacterium]